MAQSIAIPSPKEQVIPTGQNLFKTLLLIALLLGSFNTASGISELLNATTVLPINIATVLKWTVILLLAVVNGVLITGMGVLAHDAIHRVLFRSAFWNELWGGVLSALALIPFYANRQFHLTHHSYTHQPGLDPEDVMHRHSFLYAATIGSIVALNEQYRILIANLLRIGDRRYAGRALKDVCFVSFVIMVYFVWVPAFGISVMVSVVPVILLFPVIFAFRALSDHYGIPAMASKSKASQEILDTDQQLSLANNQQDVSGWVVLTSRWLEWLWSHVNYHEVHHQYPYLSHHYLPQIFAATREQQPYLIVRGYWRSLLNLRKRHYYSTPEEASLFLSGNNTNQRR